MSLNTRLELENACYNWVNSLVSGITVVWADQDAPRPSGPYFLLNLITKAIRIGSDDHKSWTYNADDDDLDYKLRGQREATLSVNAFGQAAVDALWAMKNQIELESSISTAATEGIAVLRDGDVVDLSELRDTKIEKRAQIDITIGYDTETGEPLDPIEKVVVDDQINGENITIE